MYKCIKGLGLGFGLGCRYLNLASLRHYLTSMQHVLPFHIPIPICKQNSH